MAAFKSHENLTLDGCFCDDASTDEGNNQLFNSLKELSLKFLAAHTAEDVELFIALFRYDIV